MPPLPKDNSPIAQSANSVLASLALKFQALGPDISRCKFHSNLHQHRQCRAPLGVTRAPETPASNTGAVHASSEVAEKIEFCDPQIRTRKLLLRSVQDPKKCPLQSTRFPLQPRDSAPDYHSRRTCELRWCAECFNLLDKRGAGGHVLQRTNHNKLCLPRHVTPHLAAQLAARDS
jgi:hypothetical protein